MGVVLGLIGGGSLSRLFELRLKYEIALLVMLVAQGLARGRFSGTSATSMGLAVWCASSVVLVACLAANRGTPGAIVGAAGVLLNVDVVLSNVGMPVVAPSGYGLTDAAVVSGSAGFYHLAGPGTLLAWAGDAVGLAAVGQRLLLSTGDLLLAVGVIVIVFATMTDRGAQSD